MLKLLSLVLRKNPKIFTRVILAIGIFSVSYTSLYAANIVVSPSSVTTKVGKTFTVDVMVNNNVDAINAVSALVMYPSDALTISSVSKAGSFITLWAEEPKFSNDKGTLTLEGVALNPGFNKSSGKVLSITFKAKQAGNVSVSVKSGSVLANDGNATDVLKTTGSAFVYINDEEEVEAPKESIVPVITSPTHPDSNMWYGRKDATFEWKVPSGVTAVRTLYDEKEDTTPTKVYDPPVTNRSFTVDKDGVYYMHVQFKTSAGWGVVSHYAFKVDSLPPESLKASLPDGAVTTNQTPAVLVQAEDSQSGLSKITLSVDNGQPVELPVDPSNLYHLPKQAAGNHTVVINAVDGAGNVSTVSLDYTIQAISPPVITEYTKKVGYDTNFKIVGATYPSSKVEVVLTDQDGKTYTKSVTSNDGGVFNLTFDEELPSGIYEMKARTLDGRGSVSDYTDTRVITSEKMALLRLGIFVMNWLSAILIVIIAALLVAGTLWYSFVQFARFRRKVKRNLAEVENTLRANVLELRRDTEEFKEILIKAEKKRELTKEEQAILKKFKKRLEITENEIERKLSNTLR